VLEDGRQLALDGLGLEVVHTPGHSPGSICLIDQERHLAFSGDSIQGRGERRPLLFHSYREYLESLQRVGRETVTTLVTGHPFPPMYRGIVLGADVERFVHESAVAAQELGQQVEARLSGATEGLTLASRIWSSRAAWSSRGRRTGSRASGRRGSTDGIPTRKRTRRSVMASIFEYLSYGELTKLVICASLDGVEYLIPFLLTPLVGDLFDVVGLATCLYMFRWIGLVAILELVPGFDLLPLNVLTWVIWMLSRRRGDIVDALRSGRFSFE
jgi:hypothetical protein